MMRQMIRCSVNNISKKVIMNKICEKRRLQILGRQQLYQELSWLLWSFLSILGNAHTNTHTDSCYNKCILQLLLWNEPAGKQKINRAYRFPKGGISRRLFEPALTLDIVATALICVTPNSWYNCSWPGNRKHKLSHLFYMVDLKLYAA